MASHDTQQLSFSRLYSTLSKTSPNPFSSKRLSSSESDSSVVSNIKNICLSLLQTHNAVELQNLKNETPAGVASKKEAKGFKKFKERIIEDSSVRYETLNHSRTNILSKSKERVSFNRSKGKTGQNQKLNQSRSKSIQKKVFEYILEEYKDTPTQSKQKNKHNNDERILQYFELKKKFISKIEKLPNYSKYLSTSDIDTVFKQCFAGNVPETRWQLCAINYIQSRRKKVVFA